MRWRAFDHRPMSSRPVCSVSPSSSSPNCGDASRGSMTSTAMATGARHRAVSVESIAAGSCGDPARPGGAGQTGAGGDVAGGPRGRGRLDQRRVLAIVDQPDPGARNHRLRARIRERLHLELALPAVDGIEAAFRGARMTGELRESRAQLLEEVHERIDVDQAEIRAAVGPLAVEVADVPEPGGAAKRDAVIA